jgi:hypothetical protein
MSNDPKDGLQNPRRAVVEEAVQALAQTVGAFSGRSVATRLRTRNRATENVCTPDPVDDRRVQGTLTTTPRDSQGTAKRCLEVIPRPRHTDGTSPGMRSLLARRLRPLDGPGIGRKAAVVTFAASTVRCWLPSCARGRRFASPGPAAYLLGAASKVSVPRVGQGTPAAERCR